MDEPPKPIDHRRYPDDDSTGGMLPGLWSIAMLYFIVRGIDWIGCNATVWPSLLLLPVILLFFMAIFGVGYSVVMSFKGDLEKVPDLWKDFLREGIRRYRTAPKTWTVTAMIFLLFFWTIHGRYSIHYYERGGTEFVRVEDHLRQSVSYRPTEQNCPVDE